MKLATHSGTFHADDAFAAAILLKCFPGAQIVRTRDAEEIKQADLVFDVGLEYDPSRQRFDHHFQGSPKRANGVEYSSVGLVWKQYGMRYLTLCGLDAKEAMQRWKEVDERFIIGLDAHDTGYTGDHDQTLKESKKRIQGLVSIIAEGNPTFLEMRCSAAQQQQRSLEAFYNVVEQVAAPVLEAFVQNPVANTITKTLNEASWLKQRELAHGQAIGVARKEVMALVHADSNADTIILEDKLPWDRIVTPSNAPNLKYVVYPDAGKWRCQAVPTVAKGFTPKEAFPDAWRGVKDFAKESGVAGALFCHPAGFMMGATNKESILELLDKARAIARANHQSVSQSSELN